MDISLVAKIKKYEDFVACYSDDDVNKDYNGKSLLFYSLSNNDISSRYKITDFLLDKGASAACINECGESVLHILFSRTNYDLFQTARICKKLVDSGADINHIDNKGRHAIQYLIISKYTDEELEPIYNVIFRLRIIGLNKKNAWGKSPIDIAEQIPYRKELLERMKMCE